jgi:hypothetical protein
MSSRIGSVWLLATALGLAHCSAERTRDGAPNDLMVAPAIASCPLITAVSVLPGEALVQSSVIVRATVSDDSEVRWSGVGGTFASPGRRSTLFTCQVPGPHVLTVRLHGVDASCAASSAVDILCTASPLRDAGARDAGALDAASDAVTTDE